MTIRVFCDCGKRLEVSDALKGQKINCPSCEMEVSIPSGDESQHAAVSDLESRTNEERAGRVQPDDLAVERNRPRRSKSKPSGKAVVSLTFGLLSFCAGLLTAIPALILGFLSLRDIRNSEGRLTGKGLAVGGIITSMAGIILSTAGWIGLFVLVYKVKDSLIEDAAVIQSHKDLEVLGQGLIHYSEDYGGLPPALFRQPSPRWDPRNANSGLSWRVAVLPYIGEQDLYMEFDLDQPWDSPNNLKLVSRMPSVFAHPLANDKQRQAGLTHYQAFVGQGTAFDPGLVRGGQGGMRVVGTRMGGDITDGRGNTLLIIEAADPVEWTKPDDLPFVPSKPLPKLGGHFSKGFNGLTADGKVHLLRQSAQDAALRGLITRNGGEAIDWKDLE